MAPKQSLTLDCFEKKLIRHFSGSMEWGRLAITIEAVSTVGLWAHSFLAFSISSFSKLKAKSYTLARGPRGHDQSDHLWPVFLENLDSHQMGHKIAYSSKPLGSIIVDKSGIFQRQNIALNLLTTTDAQVAKKNRKSVAPKVGP